MFHAKFRDYQTSGSEEDFFNYFFPYIEMVAILIM